MALKPVHRKFWLVLHIVSASAWIGIDVLVAVLVGVGALSDDSARRGLAYQALGSFVLWPMLVSGLVCLGTGLVLGLGTKWGLVRYWWVAVKLGLNLALCTLILLLLRPGMPEIRAYGERLSAGEAVSFDVSSLIMPPIVSLTLLSLATVLSVYKPWGRTRRRAGFGNTGAFAEADAGAVVGADADAEAVAGADAGADAGAVAGADAGAGAVAGADAGAGAVAGADVGVGEAQRARQATAKRAARTP
ncbi:hypothetical protein [Actinoplanes sp. M2I2]|uniref:hypothetical protein n=1 Tax=Actinoplanes sp. M2I2 TaxID=1734444 RepID=UPI002021BB20|nr:hypothetical protein [Actinoplanes sp. M2I2]